MKMNKNKKGQEEMVGFVIIVILVVVIGVVFLGLSLRQKAEPVQHQESMMLDTMYAMLAYSSCGDDMRGLIKECYLDPSAECDGMPVCGHVEAVFTDILDKTLGQDIANSYVHGYILNITVSGSDTEIIGFNKGITTGNYFGAEIPIMASGQDILFNLRYYYSNEDSSS